MDIACGICPKTTTLVRWLSDWMGAKTKQHLSLMIDKTTLCFLGPLGSVTIPKKKDTVFLQEIRLCYL